MGPAAPVRRGRSDGHEPGDRNVAIEDLDALAVPHGVEEPAQADPQVGHIGSLHHDHCGTSRASLNPRRPGAHNLVEGRETSGSVARGVGEGGAVRGGRLERFELGGLRFEGGRALFPLADEGSHALEYTRGPIGAELLCTFRLVLDCRNGQIAFLPSGSRR